MKRQVITIQENMVIYAPHHGEVWMTVWEIAELLNVTGTAVKNTGSADFPGWYDGKSAYPYQAY